MDKHYKEVREAQQRIKEKDWIKITPVLTNNTIQTTYFPSSNGLFFKCENFNTIGAFKIRGATNALLQLKDEEKRQGVITHSSGNHAQAVACAAQKLGVKATIVMPFNAPQVKVQATRDTYGAQVEFCEPTTEARQKKTEELIKKTGNVMIHPYNDYRIIYGAGTAALEFWEQTEGLDMVFCQVGGGGFLSGTAISCKGKSNGKTKVYGVEPERADDAYLSIKSGVLQKGTGDPGRTIADGLRTAELGKLTFEIIKHNVDEIILVSEEEIIAAMKLMFERMKIVVEPSGAVSLAGAIKLARTNNGELVRGKKIGIMISGGNIELDTLFEHLVKSSTL